MEVSFAQGEKERGETCDGPELGDKLSGLLRGLLVEKAVEDVQELVAVGKGGEDVVIFLYGVHP